MFIDAYRFGRMVVDGRAYTSDLVLLPGGGVQANWWRREGHRLSPEDLDAVLAAEPAVLVVGTGAMGVMTVPPDTRRAVEEAGIEVVVAPTGDAVERYNALVAGGRRAAGAFHLTC